MERLTLETLENKAKQAEKNYNERLRLHYRLARQLGFSATEARLLSFKSQDIIVALAKEREVKQSATRER